MSFWCHKFSKNQQQIWQISAVKTKKWSNQQKRHFLYNTMIIWATWYLKTLYGAIILWFDHFLDSGVGICQIFCWFLWKFKNIKKTFWNYLTFRNSYLCTLTLDIIKGRKKGSDWFSNLWMAPNYVFQCVIMLKKGMDGIAIRTSLPPKWGMQWSHREFTKHSKSAFFPC